jgi:hypothetical protein
MRPSEWAKAFRLQAQSDFEVYRHLSQNRFPFCHQLHYLQMTAEKTAKSFYSSEPPQTHYVLDKMFYIIANNPALRKRYGWTSRHDVEKAKKSMLPALDFLEGLVPKSGTETTVNAEYPWKQNGAVVAPCNYSYQEASNWNPLSMNIFRMFLERLLGE